MSIEEIIARALVRSAEPVEAISLTGEFSLAKAILAALDAAGYAVVPREPTYDMTMDGYQEVADPSPHNLEAAYRAMLAARPR